MKTSAVKVAISRKALRTFRRKALANKNEILAYLVGHTVRVGAQVVEIKVEEFLYPDEYEVQTPVSVAVSDAEEAKIAIRAGDREILGSIHSHPESVVAEASPSVGDIHGAAEEQCLIYGVFSIWDRGKGRRRGTAVSWYLGTPGIKVSYFK